MLVVVSFPFVLEAGQRSEVWLFCTWGRFANTVFRFVDEVILWSVSMLWSGPCLVAVWDGQGLPVLTVTWAL